MIMTLINPTLTSEVRGIRRGQRAAMRAMPFCTERTKGRPTSSVGTGRARLLGFRVGFGGQNPSLGTLRLLGFGLFRA